MNRLTRLVATAGGSLALVGLTMCGSGDSGNTGNGADSGSASGSGSTSGSGGSSGAASSGGSSGTTGSSGNASSSSGGSTSGSSSGSMSGSTSSSGSDDGGGGADTGGSDAASGQFAVTGSDFAMASGAAPPMGSNLCFKNGQTHSSGDMSPPLSWSNAPAGTLSFAVTLHDTTAGITNWVMWDIPANVTSLAAMLPSGAMPGPPAPAGSMQRGASFVGADQYAGPNAGAPVHAYVFTVWAMTGASLSIAGGDSTDTIYTQDLRGSSIGAATLLVCGDQNADCATCTDGGK